MHWDDLRVASAILRSGSYAGAAQQLGLNETTVSRRLARLESDLGFKIFDTADGMRKPTEAGRGVLEVAQRMKKETEQLASQASELPVVRRRIAAVEAMVTHYLAPRVSTLIAENPHLRIEMLLSTELASFSRWETDIALRLIRPERGNFVMRKLTDFEWVLIRPADREPCFVTGYTAQHVNKDERKMLRSRLGSKPLPMIVVNGMSPTKRMLLGGDGVGFLPDFMCGDILDAPHLRLEPLGLTRPIWLLVQEHLRDDPDTRIVTDWLTAAFAEEV